LKISRLADKPVDDSTAWGHNTEIFKLDRNPLGYSQFYL